MWQGFEMEVKQRKKKKSQIISTSIVYSDLNLPTKISLLNLIEIFSVGKNINSQTVQKTSSLVWHCHKKWETQLTERWDM